MKFQLTMRAGKSASKAGRRVLDTLLPARCAISGDVVVSPGCFSGQSLDRYPVTASSLLSGAGWASLHFIEDPYCRRCGVPFLADYGAQIECPACLANPPAYETARSAIVYDDASHKLIVGFKHSDRTELVPLFGQWLTQVCLSFISDRTIIVPVPLHRRRLLSRRYNQSALLAREVAKNTGAKCALDLLCRLRATPPQKNLSADARKRNVAGAFMVPPDAGDVIKGEHIVLIDDVLTTGATLCACARALSKAGAARVDGLTVARVVKGGIGAI